MKGVEDLCNYCTPDRKGRTLPLDVNTFFFHHGQTKMKRNTLKIYRDRNNKKKHFIAVNSMDLSESGNTMFRNNGFIMKEQIYFCPKCGRDLSQPITEGR